MRQRTIALAALLLPTGACRHPSGNTTAVGTLEIVEVDVAPVSAGRVTRVLVDEGEMVRAGDTLAILVQPSSKADIAGQAASVSASEATLREVERGPRNPEIERARATLRGAEANVTQSASDLARLRPLADKQIVSRQQLDAAMAAVKVATNRRDEARASLRLLEQGSTPEQIAAAKARVGTARAALAATQAVAGDLVLTAPVAGVVTSRNAEPGEVLTPAEPAITLGDVTRPWVRVYVNEQVLPAIHVGDTVHATLDGVPNRTFAGRVVAINPHAEYTPRVALTEDERADLMFGVKIQFADTSRTLKAGLPVTVTFANTPADRASAGRR